MTAVALSKVFNDAQFFDNNGNILAGGHIWSYQAGSDSDEQPTYADNSGDVQNTNPIVLDSSGRSKTAIWLDDSLQYHIVLTDNNDVVIRSIDNVTGSEFQFITMPGTPNYIWGTDDGTTTAAYATSQLTVGNATNALNATDAINAQKLRDGGISGGNPMSFSTDLATEPPTALWGNVDEDHNQLAPLNILPLSGFNNDIGFATLNSPNFTGTPTAPTATAGTNTAQLATTAFVQAAVSNSGTGLITLNGYQKFATGLIVQWGRTPSINQDAEIQVTFPTPFPTQIFSAFATCDYTGSSAQSADIIGQVRSITNNNMYVCRAGALRSTGGPGVVYWMAIGH